MRSKKKKIILFIVLGVMVGYALFVAFVLFHYTLIRYNPVDVAAMTYLWENEELREEVGEIRHIGRKLIGKEKDETGFYVPYRVETYHFEYDVQVYLTRENGEWVAHDWRIIKARSLD